MTMHPKVLDLSLDPKLTYITHIHHMSIHTHIHIHPHTPTYTHTHPHSHKPLHIIKVLTTRGRGKQNGTLITTYKAVMGPTLEYSSSMWSPLASSISINKLEVMQNAALRLPHDAHKTPKYIGMTKHDDVHLHALQYKLKIQHPSHPLHKHTRYLYTVTTTHPKQTCAI